MDARLQSFVNDYRTRKIPPPHVLFVGKDEHRNLCLAREFAAHFQAGYGVTDGGDLSIRGDVTAILHSNKAAILTNADRMKKPLSDLILEALVSNEIKIRIGEGPGAKVHSLDLPLAAFIATCSAKHELPAGLLGVFKHIISVDPYSDQELLRLLEAEAWKDRISFAPGAAELLIRCSNGQANLLLSRFRKVAAQIERQSNMPCFTVDEVSTSLAKLRIDLQPERVSHDHRRLDGLTGQQFEALIKALLIEMGFQAELTEVTGDGGVDIIATLDRPFCGGRYIFQCKCYAESNLVGAPAIRDFYGAVMADRAVKGIVVTTSDFSAQAKEFATQVGLELMNRTKLLDLLDKYLR